VHGQGWPPGRHVTLALAGARASLVRLLVDDDGTFSYAINQDRQFFPGGLPLGTYQVVVTAAGGARAVAAFAVAPWRRR